jgi:putative phosphoesterase
MAPLANRTIATVGSGVMAEAMIAGLLKGALVEPGQVVASHPRQERREHLEREYAIRAVAGNVDDPEDPMLEKHLAMPLGGLTVHVSHGNEVGRPTPDTLLARYDADIIVYGHTHRALVHRAGSRLVVNPGAAGPRRFDLKPSVAKLSIVDGAAEVEIVWL